MRYGLAANATTRQHSQQRGGEPRTEWEGALDEALTGEHRAKHQAYVCPLCEGIA